MNLLKQSTAATVKLGPFVDSTDGNTQETGLSIGQADIRLSKNGGAFAQTNNATGATHDANGWYGVPLDTTDTGTLGRLDVTVHKTGALCVWRDFVVVPANVYDALVGGTDVLQVDVSQFGNAAGTFASGRPEVNTTHAAGTAWGSGAITAASIAADAITAAKIANGAIDAATFAADVDAEILSYLVDDATRIDASSLNTATVTTIPAILTDTAEIGVAGAGLTAIDLPDQTMNITGNITGNVTGSVGSVAAAGIAASSLAASALNAMADGLLDRNMAAGTDSGTDDTTYRTPRQALRASRNKVTIAAGTATVTKEDDATASWTASVSTAAGNPISGVDPT